jgi:hypothetical protein
MTAILKKMPMMMMVVVVCFCMMSSASAVLAYDSSYSSSVVKVNLGGREGLELVPMPLLHQQKTAKWAATAATAAMTAASVAGPAAAALDKNEQDSSGFKSEEEEAATEGNVELELSSERVKPAKSAAAAATAATTAATAARLAAQPAHKNDEQAGSGHKSVEREAAPDGYMKLELLSEILHRVEDKAAKSAAMVVLTAVATTAARPAVQSAHKKWRQTGGGHKPEEESPNGPSRKRKRRQARQDGGEDNAGGDGGHYSVLSEVRSRVRRYLNWGGWQRRWGSYDVPQSDVALHKCAHGAQEEGAGQLPQHSSEGVEH